MSINENSDSFELIVKYGLHVKLSENSASGKRFASVGYAVSESQMEYLHEELPGDELGNKIAYRTAIFHAVQAITILRDLHAIPGK